MSFQKILNEYCDKTGCTNQRLSELSGISKSLISRYRNGERRPESDGEGLVKLAGAVIIAAHENGMPLADEHVFERLLSALLEEAYEKKKKSEIFSDNLDFIMETLRITNIEMAKALNVDSSFVSRIRKKKRVVNNTDEMAVNCARFMYEYYYKKNDYKVLANLLKKKEDELTNRKQFTDAYVEWIFSEESKGTDKIGNFLSKLDQFDLNDYIKAINFEEMRVPTSPITLATSQKYYGIKQMKTGTIDFLKATVLSRKTGEVTIASDMPMEKMAEDIEFGKQWMTGLAYIIKKEINMRVIHCMDRPFEELMLGLESWIPLYMTGQIIPYYFKSRNNNVFCHLNYTSAAAALYGECVAGHLDEGMYYLTKKKDEVEYYRRKSDRLIERAYPLMNIYRKKDSERFNAYLVSIGQIKGARRNILSSLPIYTISHKLLIQILNRNGYTNDVIDIICERVKEYKDSMKKILIDNKINDSIEILGHEQFEEKKVKIQMSILCLEYDIEYTWEEYEEHVISLRKFAAENSNYSYEQLENMAFCNIQIMMIPSKSVIISKNNIPIINFVIEYPKLREAIENMEIPVLQ